MMGNIAYFVVIFLILEGPFNIETSYVKIAAIMANVGKQTPLTNRMALQYLKNTTELLQQDYNKEDPELGCSVREGSHILEAIVYRLRYDATTDKILTEVAREMAMVAAAIFEGIGQTFCTLDCKGSCKLSLNNVKPLKTTVENCLFKMLWIVLAKMNADNKNIRDVQIFSNVSMFGYIQHVDAIFDEDNMFNIIRIPKTPGNIAARNKYQHTTVFILMLIWEENLFSFLLASCDINAGILTTNSFDENGEKVEIFDKIEILLNITTDQNDASNIIQQKYSNGSSSLRASFDVGDKNEMVSVVFDNTHECTTSGVAGNTSFEIVTTGTNVKITDESQQQMNVAFSDQVLSLNVKPPMDILVFCKACMEVADVIFVVDGSFEILNFEMIKEFIISVLRTFQISENGVHVGFVTISYNPIIIFHLNETYDPDNMTSLIFAARNSYSEPYIGRTMKTVKDEMLPRARPNVRKLVVLVAWEISYYNKESSIFSNDTLELYAETNALKDNGVEVACVGIGNFFKTISSQPSEIYFLSVGTVSELNGLSFIDNICPACMEVADVIFVVDGYVENAANFEIIKELVISVLGTLQIGKNGVHVGFVTISYTPIIVFHLNDTFDPDNMTAQILATKYPSGLPFIGQAMKIINNEMLLRSRPNVRKLIVLLVSNIYNQEIPWHTGHTCTFANDLLDLYEQTNALKDNGVEIASVRIGELDREFQTISSQPSEVYYQSVGNSSGLNNLNLFDKICAGMWKNLTSKLVRKGKTALYRLNSEFQWEESIDIKIKSMGSPVVFESNFFGTFGMSVMGIPPETIDFEEVFTDFDEKVAETPHVLAMNFGLLVALVLGGLIMRRLDLLDVLMWQYKPLADNVDSAKYSYYISVHTGFWSCLRLSSVPYIILKGWYGETMCRPLVDKGGMFRNLICWRCSNFLLKTDIKLGPLSEVKIWHDNTGENRNLFLDKILISRGKLEETFVFFCNDWLSDSKGDGKTYRRMYCANSEFKDGNNLFSSFARFRLFDDHLLLSLLGRPTFSRFTRVQRLLCIAAMLSMSFLASAMFFRTDDTVHIHGITIGPVNINYKQLYVGLMTSFMTFPIGLIVGFIFRNRRFNQSSQDMNKGDNIIKDRAKLPWYTIFVGYAMVTAAIANGAFFTTLYSLQWGPEISSDWMMSILFGTTHGIVFFDPSKVIFISLIFALVFKGFARKEIEIMAPFYEDKKDKRKRAPSDIPFYSKWPGDNKESEAHAEMRRRLGLDQKLSGYFRGILLEMLFVMLLGLICSHCVITNAYLQNDKLIQQLEPSYPINVTDDIWEWMKEKYLPNMLPRNRYNGDYMLPEEKQFMADGISYRMESVRLRQIRTLGMCKIPSIMKSTIVQCSPDLQTSTEDKHDYCPGWKHYLPSCQGTGFTYMDAKETNIFPIFGEYDMYEGGGFVRDLNPLMTDIYNQIEKLRHEHWIDNRTRFVSVENVVLNVNTKLFSQITFIFEIPTVGGIHSSASVVTSRLYPYINSWDYLVLAGQLVFVLLTFARNIVLIYDAWKLKTKCMKSLTFCSNVLSLFLSYAAIACYIARIDRTIVIVETIFNSTGEFMSFELVQLLDDIYKGCLGVVLFIAILQLLKFLSFNYYIYMMKTSIQLAQSDVNSYAVMVAIILAAFSSFMHVVYGSSSVHFRTFPSTFATLFRMMLAMVTFRDAELNSNADSNIIFSVFVFIMTILMVNVFICILNDSFAVVKSSWRDNKDIEPFDEELNEHFWWKIRQVFKSCASYSDPRSKYQKENTYDVQDAFKQLNELVGRLYVQTSAFGDGFKH